MKFSDFEIRTGFQQQTPLEIFAQSLWCLKVWSTNFKAHVLITKTERLDLGASFLLHIWPFPEIKKKKKTYLRSFKRPKPYRISDINLKAAHKHEQTPTFFPGFVWALLWGNDKSSTYLLPVSTKTSSVDGGLSWFEAHSLIVELLSTEWLCSTGMLTFMTVTCDATDVSSFCEFSWELFLDSSVEFSAEFLSKLSFNVVFSELSLEPGANC